jgi:hypothetical protein
VQLRESLTQAAYVSRVYDQVRDAAFDRVHQTAGTRSNHRPAVRHRLARDDAVALATRGDAGDRRALVVAAELGAVELQLLVLGPLELERLAVLAVGGVVAVLVLVGFA